MARKLFEFRATRARAGGLASGIEYVVWDDEAATVLADISASSGGSSIAGSTVVTADIAGLGPSACRFYGPTDDQDTLWVTCPSDPTLGVQRVEASTDARLDALEAGGGGAHPNLATHDTLGLATQTELDATKATVYVKTYVPAPDGVADNTVALQAALVAAGGGMLEFEHGKAYVQNATLDPINNTKIRGNGAVLRAGSAKTGTLNTHAMQFHLNGVIHVEIEGLKFVDPASAWGTLDSEAATIRISEVASYNKVRNCQFWNMGAPRAVWVKGHTSGSDYTSDNKITDNFIYNGGGIQYSYAGSRRTVCARNILIDAGQANSQNALGGAGNGNVGGVDLYNDDCVVEDNLIVNAGRFGIEDWTRTRGTIIRNNIVRNSDTYGISAVGYNSLVDGNTIIDPGGDGIETVGSGNRVVGNTIRYVSATPATGIIVDGGPTAPFSGATVDNNYIENALTGIGFANTPPGVVIGPGNVFVNCTTKIGPGAPAALAPHLAIPRHKSGLFYPVPAGSPVTVGPSLNDLLAAPMLVPRGITVDSLSVEVTAFGTAGAVWRLGIFNDTGDFYPGTVLRDAGTVDATSNGVKTIGSLAQAVMPGLYWIGAACQVAASSLRGVSDATIGVGSNTAGLALPNNTPGYQMAAVSGALPTFTATPLLTGTVARVIVGIA